MLGFENNLYNKGSFEVDEIIDSGMPETITIIAKGSNINKSLKQPRTQTYNNITIGALITTIASRNGVDAKISDFLTDIKIEQLNQNNETDLNLLSRLCVNYDANFKAISSVLLFYLKDDFKTTSGEVLTPFVINKSDCSGWSFRQTDKSKYDAVVAKWRDNKTGKTEKIKIGTGDSVYSLKIISSSIDEAKNKATTKYNDLLRGRTTGNLSVVGNVKIASEFEVILKGFRGSLNNFKCENCTHTLDENGYKTTLKIVNKK